MSWCVKEGVREGIRERGVYIALEQGGHIYVGQGGGSYICVGQGGGSPSSSNQLSIGMPLSRS